MLLVRAREPWELLLMRRPGGADFAPDAYVFPGGAVHANDQEWPDPIAAAAVRELFEEVGILLARRRGRFAHDRECERVRTLLTNRTFGQALRSLELEPAYDRLIPLARWVTPAQLRRRFDARFYLARLPAGQTILPQEGEVAHWMWAAPAKALSDPSVKLVYATRSVLESVASGANLSAVLKRARRQPETPIVEPRLVQTDGGWEVVR